MVHINILNGKPVVSILENGKKIKNLVLVCNIMQKMIDMKYLSNKIFLREDGKIIWEMVKEHFGWWMLKINLEENILEIGLMIEKQAEELIFIIMMIDMMGNFILLIKPILL